MAGRWASLVYYWGCTSNNEMHINGGETMPMREKDRNLRRRRRRVLKLRRLKALLVDSKDLKTRQRLIEKIHKLDPWHEIPEAK